ncbi:sensor histidine kinase [Leuconostoc sp. MS02]|uniref:histidine kinase n=1 Tax=Leuconostoc aquikimchii TaxID=3236804 RepID=A0ABV3S3B4_9LACO
MEKEIALETRQHFLKLSRWPMIFWSVMIYFLAYYLRTNSGHFDQISSVIFFALVFIQLVINFNSYQLIDLSKFFFIGLQVILIIISGILISPGETVLYMSMLPVIGIQILSLYNIKWQTLWLLLAPAQIIILVIQLMNYGLFLAFMTIEASVFLNTIIFLAWRAYHRHINTLVKTQHLLDELQLTYTEVQEISQQNERNRIGRDLHDTLMQGLAGVTMQLEGIKALLAKNNIERSIKEIDKTIDLSRDSLQEARSVVYDMRSKSTEDVNLYIRLEALGKVFYENYDLIVKFKISSEITLPQTMYDEVARIISEALSNIVKHAKTDVAIVKVTLDKTLDINIVDYGVGFNVDSGKKKYKHFGLHAIDERVKKLNGLLTINSHSGEGTEIHVQIPKKLRWQNDK